MSAASAITTGLFEFADQQPMLNVQENEFVRLLGFPREHDLDGRSRELADWARQWYADNGRPWIYGRATGGISVASDQIQFCGAEFYSERLSGQLRAVEAHDAVLVAVSAGRECEEKARECWQQGKPDEYFFLEMYGSAVVEHLVTRAAGRICGWAEQSGMAALPHYSPGYSGWPVSDQVKLWSAIRRRQSVRFPTDLQVMDTGMLRPKKSLLTVFGLTRHPEKVQPGSKLIPCENCSLPGCQYRRAAYRFSMPQTEAFAQTNNNSKTAPADSSANGFALDHNARYSLNLRALRKWAEERLHLEMTSDGSIHATFRYDGTTCSNLGLPIQYEYHVRLRPASQGYRISEVFCGPAVGDTGHANMCEYLKAPKEFMRQIAAEKPLLGRPLNEALDWKRSPNPAGCHCDAGSREHKWGIVFEVIHFALAQKEKKKGNRSLLTVPENQEIES